MNSDDIKVTIICITYNHEKYIRKTLNGFVGQKTDFKYEIIVHDDASTDGTAEIIRDYEKAYPDLFKCVYQSENQYSKNVDIFNCFIYKHVKGKYIALCEGDDYWCDNNKLQYQYNALENNPDYCMCTHLVKCCNEDGTNNSRTIPESYYGLKQDEMLNSLQVAHLLWECGGYPFHTSSYFIKSDMIVQNCMGNWTKMHRDIDYIKSAILGGGITYINKAMSVRRLNSSGNWNSRMKAQGRFAWINLTKKDIISDEKFDEFTNYKYHNIIIYSILRRCCGIVDADYKFVMDRISTIKEVPISECSFKYKIFRLFPNAVWLFKKIKNLRV